MNQGELGRGRWKSPRTYHNAPRRNYNNPAAGNNSNRRNEWNYNDRKCHRGSRGQRTRPSSVRQNHGSNTYSRNPRPEARGFPALSEKEDSSDEEAKSEKQKTASILRNRLMSLSDEYKSNSMKELIGGESQNESLPSVAKPTESEKQARRIAHVPKPIKPSQPSLNPPPPKELHNENIAPNPAVHSKKSIQDLIENLITRSPDDLKRIATAPRRNEMGVFRHLTAIHRSRMSEAVRKLAEQKIQNDSSPLLLAELEQLVQPDTAVDLFNMSLETLQTLQDIFNLHVSYDNQPEAADHSIRNVVSDNQPEAADHSIGNIISDNQPEAADHSIGNITSDHQPETAAPSIPNLNYDCQPEGIILTKTEPSFNFWEDAEVNERSFQIEDSCINHVPPPCYELSANAQLSVDSTAKKTKKKKGKKTVARKTQTDVKSCQEMSSQTEDKPHNRNGRPEQLLTELQHLLGVMSSCDESSHILQSTALSCISALIQNFTKQFSELNPRKNARIVDDSDSFLDSGGIIKRIKITANNQSGLVFPKESVTVEHTFEVATSHLHPTSRAVDHSLAPSDEEKFLFYVSGNGV